MAPSKLNVPIIAFPRAKAHDPNALLICKVGTIGGGYTPLSVISVLSSLNISFSWTNVLSTLRGKARRQRVEALLAEANQNETIRLLNNITSERER
mgnify:CR=1 FL=1